MAVLRVCKTQASNWYARNGSAARAGTHAAPMRNEKKTRKRAGMSDMKVEMSNIVSTLADIGHRGGGVNGGKSVDAAGVEPATFAL
jgi:hypothetical protein